MNEVSDKICLLIRKQRDNVPSPAVVAPITPSIQSKLSSRFRNLRHLYKCFEKLPKLRKVAGTFYEAIVQLYLQGEGILKVFPMVTLEETNRKRSKDGPQHQWYSSHIIIPNPALEARCLKVSNSFDIKIQTGSSNIRTTDCSPSNRMFSTYRK